MTARTLLLTTALLAAAATAIAFAPNPTADAKGPTLADIKRLAGEWVQVGDDGALSNRVVTSYRVTAGGSAVLEILFPGTDHEMLTVYHQDGDDLVLTHYCVMGNQPRMRAKKDAPEGTLVFECFDVMNTKSHDDKHMHKGVVRIEGEDRLQSTWYSVERGETVYKAEFKLARKPRSRDASR